ARFHVRPRGLSVYQPGKVLRAGSCLEGTDRRLGEKDIRVAIIPDSPRVDVRADRVQGIEDEMPARQPRDGAPGGKGPVNLVEADQHGVVVTVRVREAAVGAGAEDEVDAVGQADAGVRDVVPSRGDARTFLTDKERGAVVLREVGQKER